METELDSEEEGLNQIGFKKVPIVVVNALKELYPEIEWEGSTMKIDESITERDMGILNSLREDYVAKNIGNFTQKVIDADSKERLSPIMTSILLRIKFQMQL